MKAYINTLRAEVGGTGSFVGFYCEVISEQDYHEGGPWAHSYRTKPKEIKKEVVEEAKEWAAKNGYTIVDSKEITQ